ncbi:hypothetical protein LJ737_24690 [Hymenobacter sp. 15J16-1T3B]|uniref:hypothetical protein n=1 Tax=Hymenobacter sp. 15J16-1T3B TaxID=2886941 RepID=UPI001D0F7C7A|nr:hypothetical protein [Hymenobacter sp. 15J16-1T3B]MCC3160458.1 hypothetical protein [Hymenobacter sp. 15J16-1T3B]
MKLLFPLLAAGLLSTGATAQIMVPPGPGGVPGRMPTRALGPTGYATAQPGTCVLPDSSRVKGELWLRYGKHPNLEVETDDGQKREYTPRQLAYFTIGPATFVPVDFVQNARSTDSTSITPVFAKVLEKGNIEVLRYSYTANVGGVRMSTLLLRQRGATTWAQLPEGGAMTSQKRLREVVGPLVADQPSYARILTTGRITIENLPEFLHSYNAYAAKQP